MPPETSKSLNTSVNEPQNDENSLRQTVYMNGFIEIDHAIDLYD